MAQDNRTALRFRDLLIGQTFDFVDDARPGYNSFFARVYKASARTYVEVEAPHTSYQVGSINAQVFHVGASASWETARVAAQPCYAEIDPESAEPFHCHRIEGHAGPHADWSPEECLVEGCACTEVEA